MFIRILLAAALMFAQSWAVAQTADAPPRLTPDQARAQRAKARDMKEQARKTYEAEVKACQGKAIAIGCMSSAKERRTETLQQADALEREGRNAERDASRREAEAKAATRTAQPVGVEDSSKGASPSCRARPSMCGSPKAEATTAPASASATAAARATYAGGRWTC